MSSAFVSLVSPGSFLSTSRSQLSSKTICQNPSQPPQMTANWPDDTGPAYSKYLSNIPLDRLNKAPEITINKFPDENYNSISVRLADMLADQGEGDSLKAGIVIDDEKPPSQALWEKYYDPDTVNEAPVISLYGSDKLPFHKHAIYLLQTTIPTNISAGKSILDKGDPDPKLYEDTYKGRLNMVPIINMNYQTSDMDSYVTVESVYEPLNSYAADLILNKYRS